jgi:hypothetical protein
VELTAQDFERIPQENLRVRSVDFARLWLAAEQRADALKREGQGDWYLELDSTQVAATIREHLYGTYKASTRHLTHQAENPENVPMAAARRQSRPNAKLYNLRDGMGQSQEDVADALNLLASARGRTTAVAGNHVSRWRGARTTHHRCTGSCWPNTSELPSPTSASCASGQFRLGAQDRWWARPAIC